MPNLTSLLEDFLCYHESTGHSMQTVSWYRGQLTAFLLWLDRTGNLPDTRTVERYMADRRAAGNAPATVAGHYRALKSFFAWLTKRGLIEQNPMVDVHPPKVPRRVPKRTGPDSFHYLVQSIEGNTWIGCRDKLVVNLLFLCGLRRGECARLRVEDFRLPEHLLCVREGKGGGDRFVPLLPAVERAFVAYLFMRPPVAGPLLVAADNHNRAQTRELTGNGIYQMLRRRCNQAGLPMMNPHSFRHGMAMHLLNEGGDMSLVQKILGHAQITTTMAHYAEWVTQGMVREYSERMRGLGL